MSLLEPLIVSSWEITLALDADDGIANNWALMFVMVLLLFRFFLNIFSGLLIIWLYSWYLWWCVCLPVSSVLDICGGLLVILSSLFSIFVVDCRWPLILVVVQHLFISSSLDISSDLSVNINFSKFIPSWQCIFNTQNSQALNINC